MPCRRQLLIALAAVITAGGLMGVSARPAQAHSELLSTAPSFGDKVAAPAEVVLRYDDWVDLHGSSAELHGGGNKALKSGKLEFSGSDRKVVSAKLPALPKGGYRFTWVLTGSDGHVEGGEIVFTVDPDAAVSAPAPALNSGPAAPAAAVAASSPAEPDPKFSRFAPAAPAPPAAAAPAPAGINQSQTAADVLGLGPGSDGTLPEAPKLASELKRGFPPYPRLSASVIPETAGDGQLASGSTAIASPIRLGSAGLAAVASTTRFVGFAGLALLVGGLALIALFWPAGAAVPRARRLLWGGLLASLVATALTFGLTGASLKGLGPLDALRPSVAGTIMGSHQGGVLSARLIFLLLAAPALALLAVKPERMAESVWWRLGALAAVVGAVGTYGLLGHPYSEGGAASAAAVVHMVAAFLWLGGLVFLLAVVLPRRRGDEVLRLVPGFSSLAGASVAAMSLSGVALLVLIRPDWGDLLASGYGRYLVLKLALVGVMLVAAAKARAFTHKVLLARSIDGGFVRLSPLISACAVEVFLAVGVLSATAILVGRAPQT